MAGKEVIILSTGTFQAEEVVGHTPGY